MVFLITVKKTHLACIATLHPLSFSDQFKMYYTGVPFKYMVFYFMLHHGMGWCHAMYLINHALFMTVTVTPMILRCAINLNVLPRVIQTIRRVASWLSLSTPSQHIPNFLRLENVINVTPLVADRTHLMSDYQSLAQID